MDKKKVGGVALLCMVVILVSFSLSKTYVDIKTEEANTAALGIKNFFWPTKTVQPVTPGVTTVPAIGNGGSSVNSRYTCTDIIQIIADGKAALDDWNEKKMAARNAHDAVLDSLLNPSDPQYQALVAERDRLEAVAQEAHRKYRSIRDQEHKCQAAQESKQKSMQVNQVVR